MPPAEAQRIPERRARSNEPREAARELSAADAFPRTPARPALPRRLVPIPNALALPFRIAARIRSLRCALNGIAVVLRTQHNAWLHFAGTAAVVPLGLALDLSRSDWCWLVLAIASVWTAELFNTALELLADVVSPDYDPAIGRVKDVAAGAVLVAAVGAAAIGLLVLGPPLWAKIAA